MDMGSVATLIFIISFCALVAALIGSYLYKRWEKKEAQKRFRNLLQSNKGNLIQEIQIDGEINAVSSMRAVGEAIHNMGKRSSPPPLPSTSTSRTSQINAVINHQVRQSDVDNYRRSATTSRNTHRHVDTVDLDTHRHTMHISELSGPSYGGCSGGSSGSSGSDSGSSSSDSGSSCSSD